MRPTRRALVLALAAAPIAGAALGPAASAQVLSRDDQALVDRAVAYLEGLSEAHARFIQTDPRGQTSTGEFFLQRPGKARFAYDPPSGLTVVSDGKTVYVADSRLKTLNHYPLAATPLSLFLARQIRLDQGVRVTNIERMSDGFTLTARDIRPRGVSGHIALTFTDKPLALEGWAVTDAQGRTTQVRLSGLERRSGLDPALFEAAGLQKSAAGAKM